MYAIQHGIGYDDIPKDFFITTNEAGALQVITKSQQPEKANRYNKKDHQENRLQVINRKLQELLIMRD